MTLDKDNYKIIEISKVDNKIIKKLIDNLKLGISDDFFISFESLLKLGKKAESVIESQIKDIDNEHNFKKEIFNILLKFLKTKEIENPLITQLYHPDFTIRAKAIIHLEKNEALKYLNFILPLTSDPDDSVRWAVIKLLGTLNHLENPNISKVLKKQLDFESNPVIQKKIKKILKKS